ncbi:hypothetical protein MANES_17G089367v8 [Manihot esculenta]|uniref:Uncharacterized protein n=1 Tax=Manihot esculenta TaxID=3983 RepID=A0ACB7G3I1_MANES|nr:hypothetical protein MANES_17G089367v8 [Manihot esculenta]
MKQFADIKAQIEKISGEISEYSNFNKSLMSSLITDEQDFSLRKLNEFQTHLRTLQKKKSDRLHKVIEYVNEVHSLCGVLGLDFGKTVGDVHPSLHGENREQSTNISSGTLEGLEQTIIMLKLERKARIQKDSNRYNAGMGAHINLKCAERARVTISKIPAMVNNLISKTLAWEKEKKDVISL